MKMSERSDAPSAAEVATLNTYLDSIVGETNRKELVAELDFWLLHRVVKDWLHKNDMLDSIDHLHLFN